jgi:hypothetical protein
MNNNSSKRA